MSIEKQQLETVIAGLEAQRALLGDALIDASLVPLRARLAALIAPTAVPSACAPQTRKQVTILFLDVVASTALSQHLDSEDIHAVLDGALACCTAIVGAHQGKVLQYAGDSLLAVYGADESREDDPERAVHASLTLLREGRRQGDLVAQRHGYAGFNLRVGIHTGGVLQARLDGLKPAEKLALCRCAHNIDHRARVWLITHFQCISQSGQAFEDASP